MEIIPKTMRGLGIYILVTFILVAVMFSQQYGWVNWNKYLRKGQTA